VNIDFAETLLDYAGANPLPETQGRTIRPILRGKAPPDWRTELYYRYWMHRAHFDIPAHLGVRTREHKLIYFYGESCGKTGALPPPAATGWELYDLQQDPNELNNLYADPAAQTTVHKLKGRIKELQRQYGDTGACGAFAVEASRG
jgi:arylsulfatase A-like enzyme